MSGTKARLSKPEAKVFSDGNILFFWEGGNVVSKAMGSYREACLLGPTRWHHLIDKTWSALTLATICWAPEIIGDRPYII